MSIGKDGKPAYFYPNLSENENYKKTQDNSLYGGDFVDRNISAPIVDMVNRITTAGDAMFPERHKKNKALNEPRVVQMADMARPKGSEEKKLQALLKNKTMTLGRTRSYLKPADLKAREDEIKEQEEYELNEALRLSKLEADAAAMAAQIDEEPEEYYSFQHTKYGAPIDEEDEEEEEEDDNDKDKGNE